MSVGFPVAFRSAQARLALLAVAVVGLGGFIVVARTRLTNSVRAEAPAFAQEPAAVVALSLSRSPRGRGSLRMYSR